MYDLGLFFWGEKNANCVLKFPVREIELSKNVDITPRLHDCGERIAMMSSNILRSSSVCTMPIYRVKQR